MRFPRSSGVLLHPTSLPGPHGAGDLGPAAYHFVDWLVGAGQRVWQILPLNPVGMGNSPYMGLSAFAGNPLLIGMEELIEKGWISGEDARRLGGENAHRIDFPRLIEGRMKLLRTAAATFSEKASSEDRCAFAEFVEQSRSWLADYALFMALIEKEKGKEWSAWDRDLARRDPLALKKVERELADEIKFWEFTQWSFFRQWRSLKKYANEKGVQIFGDIPIFVAYQSADVWARPDLFSLDESLKPLYVAGVPPDYFSETGQRWGNPLYRWDIMEREGYRWWIERIRATLAMVDIVRIDHFRGFEAYWEIPASEKTAVHGRWAKGPNERLFEAILKELGRLPIVAEDLGLMTPEVFALRDRFNFPGMKVLQFAFAGDTSNSFLPHNYERNVVAYTGTHDNDTTRSWFETATEREKAFVQRYTGNNGANINWDLIRLASQSVADMVIYPLQDVLGLGNEARMNLPGKPDGNWDWRFTWDMVTPQHGVRLREMSMLHSRCSADRLELPPFPSGKAKP